MLKHTILYSNTPVPPRVGLKVRVLLILSSIITNMIFIIILMLRSNIFGVPDVQLRILGAKLPEEAGAGQMDGHSSILSDAEIKNCQRAG